jgi:hypothetical protein
MTARAEPARTAIWGAPWRCRRQGTHFGQWKACRLPQWATWRPIFAACSSADRKWTPDCPRAWTMSAQTCEKLVKRACDAPLVLTPSK